MKLDSQPFVVARSYTASEPQATKLSCRTLISFGMNSTHSTKLCTSKKKRKVIQESPLPRIPMNVGMMEIFMCVKFGN